MKFQALVLVVFSSASHGFLMQPQRPCQRSQKWRDFTLSKSINPTLLSLAKQSLTQEQEPKQGRIQWTTRSQGWRPDAADVERISWGKPAKKKGTGSRGTPHRLNQDERVLFDQARRKGFLELAGSGWRAQRRDAPLLNTYRSWCDAQKCVNLVLHKSHDGTQDELVLDFSPLRLPGAFEEVARQCLTLYPGGRIDSGTLLLETNNNNSVEHNNERDNDKDAIMTMEDDAFETRPIYQLPSYCLVWQLPRAEAKQLGKKLASEFDTVDTKSAASKKPTHIKPGKGRRHGGYGIG